MLCAGPETAPRQEGKLDRRPRPDPTPPDIARARHPHRDNMASFGEDLLHTVNKLQDLVFNTIGSDSLDLPQIVCCSPPARPAPAVEDVADGARRSWSARSRVARARCWRTS